MARPSPNIIKTIELKDDSTWDIYVAEEQYTITYQGQACGVRQHYQSLNYQGFRYQKLCYTNLGNAEAQARRLNHKFKCNDFAVKKL